MSIQEYHFTDDMGQQSIVKYFSLFVIMFCVFDYSHNIRPKSRSNILVLSEMEKEY